MYKIYQWIGKNENMEQGLLVDDEKTLMTIVENLPTHSAVNVIKDGKGVCWITKGEGVLQSTPHRTEEDFNRANIPDVHLELSFYPVDTHVYDKEGKEVKGIKNFKLHYNANSEWLWPLLEMELMTLVKNDYIDIPDHLIPDITHAWSDKETVTVFANVISIKYVDPVPFKDDSYSAGMTVDGDLITDRHPLVGTVDMRGVEMRFGINVKE